jgi:hypothetical protein
MSREDYIKLSKEQTARIGDFHNSLLLINFKDQDTIDYHKKWLDHIIEKGKQLQDIEEDLINKRKNGH